MMVLTDEKANKIIKDELQSIRGKDLKKLLTITDILCNEYSFVDNQTYPRPSHPLESKRTDPYFTLIAILLSLRTTLENEIKAVDNFRDKYKSIEDVRNSDVKELSDVIKMAGMPLKKAKNIKMVTEYIINNLNGDICKIKNTDIKDVREELMKIPGVGEKSADCMLELGFDMPSMVVDTNVFRVISRMFSFPWADKPDFDSRFQISEIKKFLDKALPPDYLVHQIVHTMILLHGKYICKSIPKCNECKLRSMCDYRK
jgi:endonuclease-3